MTFEGYTNQATHFLPLREVGLDLCIVPAGDPQGAASPRSKRPERAVVVSPGSLLRCRVGGERPLTLEGDRTATTLGRFYGYSEAAIAAFMGRCHKSPSSAVPEPCSHGTVTGRRGPNFPPERTSTMCAHNPPCPTAMAPDREAARPIAHRPEQGWSLLCNGVLVFEDTGELLPDGRIVAPHRPLALTVGSAA